MKDGFGRAEAYGKKNVKRRMMTGFGKTEAYGKKNKK